MLQFELYKKGKETGIIVDAMSEDDAWNILFKQKIKHNENNDLIEV